MAVASVFAGSIAAAAAPVRATPVELAAQASSAFSVATSQAGRASNAGPRQAVRVDLVAADSSLLLGRKQWLGLRFVLEPGWHIYWVNPGDSGGPPTVKWSLPPGFTAGQFEWPTPERIGEPPIVNYGYHGEVTLPFELSVPAAAETSGPAVIGGDVRYLICRDVCVPGRTRVEVVFPPTARAGGAVGAGRAAIDGARARVPKPAPQAWQVRAHSQAERFILEIDTGQNERNAHFFPLEASQIDDGAPPGITPTPRGVRFELRKSAQLLKDPAALRGVLTLSSGQSFVVQAPITGLAAR